MAKKVKVKPKKVIQNEKKSKKSSSCWKILLVSSAVIAAVLSVAGFWVYCIVTEIPELPQIDLNENWGPKDKVNEDSSIRPYRIVFSDTMQEETRLLFELYRRAEKPSSFNETGWAYGVNSHGFEQFIHEWIFNYNFVERAKFLNTYEQFKTVIQGLDIHFMRVKPKVEKNVQVVPLLILHGWPSSIRDYYDAIPKLITPREGYKFVFEVIVPSIPGFIYSEGATRPGLNCLKIAVIMRNLMHRLGHKTFYVQGGDFGHQIGSHMATLFPKEVLGFHSNLPINFSKYAVLTWLAGSVWPSYFGGQFHDRMYPLSEKLNFFIEEFGYMHLQSTKPDTIGIALQDSPAGLASYMIDRILIFTNPENKKLLEGGLDRTYNMEKLIDNVMLYWASRSMTTALRLYKETVISSEVEQVMARIPTSVPTWFLRLRHEPFQHPDFILRWKYPVLAGTSTAEYGGHFAAFERPKTFSDDVFVAVKAFRREK